MLVKAELKNVPLSSPEWESEEEHNANEYLATVQIIGVIRCGKILCIDYYNLKNKELQVRFFSDSKNYICYDPKEDKWNKRYIVSFLQERSELLNGSYDIEVHYSEEEMDEAQKFLGIKDVPSTLFLDSIDNTVMYSNEGTNVPDTFIHQCNEKKRARAQKKQLSDFDRYTSWFPRFDNKYFGYKYRAFCEEKALKNRYIFISNLNKKHKRNCTCAHCGGKFEGNAEMKHKGTGICPLCGSKATYILERYQHNLRDQALVCDPHAHDGQLILRWAKVTRRYEDLKPKFVAIEQAYTFYLKENGIPQMFSYFLVQNWFGGERQWSKKRKDEKVWSSAFVYDEDLTEIFGERFYDVNLKKILESQKNPIDFIRLLDNLQDLPITKFLARSGMLRLASRADALNVNDSGHSFSSVLGLPGQYAKIYKDLDVTLEEHQLIKALNETINEETVLKIRSLDLSFFESQRIRNCVKYQRIETLLNYIERQCSVVENKATARSVLIWLSDYYSMCNELSIPLNKNNLRPKDIKESHDRLSKRVTEVRNAEVEAKSVAALKKANEWFDGYEKNGLTIRLPQKRSDLIREGEILHHCVGSMHYYDRHVKSESIIVFIRNSAEPDKPMYTGEIAPKTMSIVQLYGPHDTPAPPEIRKFLTEFCFKMKHSSKAVKAAG